MVKCYNFHRYGNYYSYFTNQAPTEGINYFNFVTDASSTNNNNNDALDGSGEAKTMLAVMDIRQLQAVL